MTVLLKFTYPVPVLFTDRTDNPSPVDNAPPPANGKVVAIAVLPARKLPVDCLLLNVVQSVEDR